MRLPWQLESLVRRGPPLSADPKARAWVSIMSTVVLALSAFVLMGNSSFIELQTILKETLSNYGLGFSVDYVLVGAVVAVALAGMLDEAWLPLALLFSWLMLLPSLLYYSSVDWFLSLGLDLNFGDLSNFLPGWLVFLNGLILVSASVMMRSYLQLRRTRENLIERGAIREEIDVSLREYLSFNAKIVAACSLGATAIATMVVIFTPAFSDLSVLSPYVYIAIALMVELLIIAFIVRFLKQGSRTNDQ